MRVLDTAVPLGIFEKIVAAPSPFAVRRKKAANVGRPWSADWGRICSPPPEMSWCPWDGAEKEGLGFMTIGRRRFAPVGG